MPDTSKIATFWTKAHIHENGLYIMTSYFTDPDTICSGQRATKKDYVGDNLYLVLNNGPVKIPLKEDHVSGTMWTKGKCFYGMGKYCYIFCTNHQIAIKLFYTSTSAHFKTGSNDSLCFDRCTSDIFSFYYTHIIILYDLSTKEIVEKK